MIGPSQIGYLLANIIAAEDEAAIVDLLTENANAIGELPPRERERAVERICDAVRERRALPIDEPDNATGNSADKGG